jgi:hypothetical protein
MATKCGLMGHCATSCVKCLHHINYCSVFLFFVSYIGQIVTSVYRERKVMQYIRHQHNEHNCY